MTAFNSGLSLSGSTRKKGTEGWMTTERYHSLDIKIHGAVIILTDAGLYPTIKQVTEGSGCKKGPGAVPVWNVERGIGMGARRDRSRGVVGA